MIQTFEAFIADQIQRINYCKNPDKDVMDFINEINQKD